MGCVPSPILGGLAFPEWLYPSHLSAKDTSALIEAFVCHARI